MKTNRLRSIGWLFFSVIIVRISIYLFGGWVIENTDINDLLILFLSQLTYVIPVLVYLILKREPVKNVVRIKNVSLKTVGLVFIIAMLVIPITAFVNGISLLFVENTVVNSLGSMASSSGFVAFLLVSAVTPAIMEEGVYRGVVLSDFRKSGLWKGILISAFLFALLHLNLNQFMYAFVFGVIMALIVEVTGSVLMSMLVHFLMNAMSTTVMYITQILTQGKLQETAASAASQKTVLIGVVCFYGVLAIACSIGIVLILSVIAKIEKREVIFNALNPFLKEKPYLYQKAKAFSVPLLLGMLLCIVVIVINLVLS